MDAAGLPDRLAARLARGRAAAEARMLDTFEFGVLGEWAYNPTSGVTERQFTPTFTTPGRVRVVRLDPREVEVGGRTVTEMRREITIPVASPAVTVGMGVRCTAVDPTSDPTLLGVLVEVTGVAPGSQTTARRITVEEVLS